MSIYVIYKDVRGHWRWTAVASNGRKIADSAEGYFNKLDCLNGIRLMANSSNWMVHERPA
ncbi:MAG: YegP family protein [Gammaproteobacteria bacterium]